MKAIAIAIASIVNVLAIFILLEGVSKTISVLIIIAVALANYFDGRVRAEKNLKK
jgi:hypothetical protein